MGGLAMYDMCGLMLFKNGSSVVESSIVHLSAACQVYIEGQLTSNPHLCSLGTPKSHPPTSQTVMLGPQTRLHTAKPDRPDQIHQ